MAPVSTFSFNLSFHKIGKTFACYLAVLLLETRKKREQGERPMNSNQREFRTVRKGMAFIMHSIKQEMKQKFKSY